MDSYYIVQKEIDIEDLDKKGDYLMNREFNKPTEKDIKKFTPIIKEIINSKTVDLAVLSRKHKFSEKRSFLFQIYLALLQRGEITELDDSIRDIFQTKAVKSWSGVCNVTIFTSPFPEYTNEEGECVVQSFSCGKKCSFCPSEKDMPKSYLTLEPATLRAKKNNFDCVQQMHDRMSTLYITGHTNLSKLEVNILGGTFSHYPKLYRIEFVRDLYYAANIYWSGPRDRLSLNQEKIINQTAKCRIVQVVIETRPDSINPEEIKLLRYLSVTRVQLGIQHIDDEILDKNNRDCPSYKAIRAINELKRIGMKIDGHVMPNLPFTSVEKDQDMFEKFLELNCPVHREIKSNKTWMEWLFSKNKPDKPEHWEYYDLAYPEWSIDQMKIYPCAVTVYTDIEKWYKEGTYIPYDNKHLIDMLYKFKTMIFPWIRLNRIMRDFYSDNIFSISGSQLNMRDDLHKLLELNGNRCNCIRCRESKLNKLQDDYIIVIRQYNGPHDAYEYFISAESKDYRILYGFVRLRLDDAENKIFPELNNAALIREAHVYSKVAEIGQKGDVQHIGLGTILMKKAEDIAKRNQYNKVAVIASIGSRSFYEKIGYTLDSGDGEYMIKII